MPVEIAQRPPKPFVKTKRLHLDFETFSEADLPKVGASVYARHPSTEVLMLSYGWGTGEIKQWVPAEGEEFPDDLWEALHDPTVLLYAWNAPFEMAIFEHVLGVKIPVERWRDVMALAYSLSLPGKLEKAGKIVGLPEDQQKMNRGKALLRKFTRPRKPSKYKPWTRSDQHTDPEDWKEFLEYNVRDVEAERQIYKRIKKYDMPAHEWDLWHLDQKINNAGIPVNLNAVRAAMRLAQVTIKKDLQIMADITGLDNPNSNVQLLPWLREHGYPYLDLKKGHVERAYDQVKAWEADGTAEILGIHPNLSEVLYRRLRVSKASVKKFTALDLATDPVGNGFYGLLRGCHQFAGAGRTWRWSGRRFQPQNLPKPEPYLEKIIPELAWEVEHLDPGAIALLHENPMDVLTGAVRPMVQAPPGYLLIDADLSAIENVVLGWLAGDEKILRVFREGLDPYIDFATEMFQRSYSEIEAIVASGDKSMRTTAKPGVLGCGYMLGPGEAKENPKTGEIEATGLLGYGWAMGVNLTPEMSELSVKTFRSKFEDVVQFWWDLDKACRKVITTGKEQRVGYLRIVMEGPFMRIILPSGRALSYLRPKLLKRRTPWGEMRYQITYENLENNVWRRVTTHPGKLAENVTQAVARDLLAHGMTLADRAGIDIRMHVHDQIVALAPEDQAEHLLSVLIRCMTTLPAWADDKLPLKAAGFVTPVFLKD